MRCFRKSSGRYILNGAKKCTPVADDGIEFTTTVDHPPSPEPITTNGNGNATIAAEEEPEERRAGIQAPVIKVDENSSSSVTKYEKSAE